MIDSHLSDTSERYKDVNLSSHENLAAEIKTMLRIVDGMGAPGQRIETVWCDSNAGATYTVYAIPGSWHDDSPRAVADAAYTTGGTLASISKAKAGTAPCRRLASFARLKRWSYSD